jgi:flavin-dependent dehydrogenase
MNIVIVGGGTAGWIAAYFILKSQPGSHKITVIESSAIGIIGAGEGSTGALLDLFNGTWFDHKIDIEDFMKKTDSTKKMGIRHTNWSADNVSYFAPLDISPTGFDLNDYIFKYVLSEFGRDKIHIASKIGIEYENKDYSNNYAFHFDAHKVGKYFKEICLADNATVLDETITDVILDTETGFIKQLITNNGKKIDGDLFIDCTGFARILMKKLGVNWVSYKDVLPVNTAMPFIVNYKNDEEILPETKATALSSGWMWDIPLTTRRGCGYVFDSNCLSNEEAKKEVEDYLGFEVTPLKFIKFDSGYSEFFWKKNTVCLGLSSSFVEPLEATSIHNTIIQIAIFVNEFLSADKALVFKQENEDVYNQRVAKLNNLTIDFISMHYQGGRDDTPFWKKIKEQKMVTKNADLIVNRLSSRIPCAAMLDGMYGSFSIPLANWIFAGMGLITPDQAHNDLQNRSVYEFSKKRFNSFYQRITGQKKYITFI